MKSIHALVFAVPAAVLSTGALAAPEIVSGGTVTIRNNKASNIVAGGGSLDIGKLGGKGKGLGSLSLNGAANVNSLVMYDNNAKVGGTVLIENNKADGVYAIGGTANVNSVVMGTPAPAQ
jgi:hypothetical protein